VPGVNYNTLLHRSTGFQEFFSVVKGVFTDTREQDILLAVMQLGWDPTDSVSYVGHLSTPFPGQPASRVIAAPSAGDYLVTPVTYENVARSGLDFHVMSPYSNEREIDLVTQVQYPLTEGSAIVHWWLGNPWAPKGNAPPPTHRYGDPHGEVRLIDSHSDQMVHFFKTGEVIDVCNGKVCPDEDRSVLDD
jgi:hypothetical protein